MQTISSLNIHQMPVSFASFLVSQPVFNTNPFAQYDAMTPYDRTWLQGEFDSEQWSVHAKAAKDAPYALLLIGPRTYGLIKRVSITRQRLGSKGLQDFESFSLEHRGSFEQIAKHLTILLPADIQEER